MTTLKPREFSHFFLKSITLFTLCDLSCDLPVNETRKVKCLQEKGQELGWQHRQVFLVVQCCLLWNSETNHSLLNSTTATQTTNLVKKHSICACETNGMNEMISSVAMRQSTQIAWVSWQPSALTMYYTQLHHHKNALLKQCSFDLRR